jgi:hypothetical protein
VRWPKKTAEMGAACALKHRFFCPFLGSSFGHAKEEQKKPGFWLGKAGKQVIIPGFNEYMYRRVKMADKVMRMKDHIFNESFELGRTIEKHLTPAQP